MMQPVSVVNNKNYHLLGNRLVGESHSSRMARVKRVNRMNGDPTLKPLALGFIPDGTGYEPLVYAGGIGAVFGLLQRFVFKNESDMLLSKGGDRQTAIISMLLGGLAAGGANAFAGEGLQSIPMLVGGAALAGVMHGLVTGSKHWF